MDPGNIKSAARQPEVRLVLFCILIFIGLQGVRHCYFLTDDNLSGWLPIVVEFSRRIFELKNPFFNPYLYGGTDLSRDVGILTLCNPLTLVISPLSLTRLSYWMADITALFHLSLGAVLFYRMSRALQVRQGLVLSSGNSIFLSLSWTFCAYSLAIGPSWVNFLANLVALPLLFWGFFHPRPRTSTALLLAGTAYALFFGHLHPFLYSAAIMTIVAVVVAVCEKRLGLLVRWVGVYLVVMILALPILLPGFLNVMHSVRSEIITASDSAQINVPALVLSASLIAGPLVLFSGAAAEIFYLTPAWSAALGFSAAALCFGASLYQAGAKAFPVFKIVAGITLVLFLCWPVPYVLILVPFFVLLLLGAWAVLRDSRVCFLEKLAVAMILFLLVLVQRPDFLTDIIAVIPFYKMLHWPFREIIEVVFFVHVFLCFGIGNLSENALRRCSFAGVLILMTLPILGLGGGSLNPMEEDRKLIISGEAASWWSKNQAISGKEKWLPVIDHVNADQLAYDIPFSLLGAYNYPSLFRVEGAVGYWGSWIPLQGLLQGVEPYHNSGIITQEDMDKLNKLEKFQYVRVRLVKGGWVQVEAFGEKGVRTMSYKRKETE